ncbi:MAG: D-glycero-beta-D-manno-heptose 1-phosphate adenylyltransferase [Bacteroidetes bacterium]|nr:MAG: D-glycero-beta-D-manno-heptose 1-phosphate adenylyltransferase [Bacteroidota bacterium]
MPDRIEQKFYSKEIIGKQITSWKTEGLSIVFTNGVFDIIHRGHIDYLYKASLKGDKLIIGLNSDSSVKRLGKGDSRPYNSEENRAYLLAAFGFIDGVVVFDEDTPIELIELIKPDVLVKGGDYDASAKKGDKQYIVGSDIVKSYDGVVEVIPFLKGFSTTSLVEKIKNSV